MRSIHRLSATLLVGALLAAVSGCGHPPIRDDFVDVDERATEYAAVAENYNKHIEPVDQFRAHGRIAVQWQDREGETQTEAGDGLILFRRPYELALTVDKMGHSVIWAGADAEEYWFFELHQEQVLMRGRNENIGRPCAAQLPFSINPHRLGHLLGLIPLEIPEDPGEHPELRRDSAGNYRFVIPGGGVEMRIDPDTYLPVRVSTLDESGEPRLVSHLSDSQAVSLGHSAAQARVNSRAEINVVAEDAWMTIRMGQLSDGREGNPIPEAAFDLQTLIRAHSPREIIVLDKDCD